MTVHSVAIPLGIAMFPTAFPAGPAVGTATQTTWPEFTQTLRLRREGPKDGPGFASAVFMPEPNGRVRRIKENLLARTAVVLDIETNKLTGEVPPGVGEVATRIRKRGWAATIYTSHNHTAAAPRYRVVSPLSADLAPDVPAVEVVAEQLGLAGVCDTSKCGAVSFFYLPSCEPGQLEQQWQAAGGGTTGRWPTRR